MNEVGLLQEGCVKDAGSSPSKRRGSGSKDSCFAVAGGCVSRDCAGQRATVAISQDYLRICALGGAICLGLGKEDLGA